MVAKYNSDGEQIWIKKFHGSDIYVSGSKANSIVIKGNTAFVTAYRFLAENVGDNYYAYDYSLLSYDLDNGDVTHLENNEITYADNDWLDVDVDDADSIFVVGDSGDDWYIAKIGDNSTTFDFGGEDRAKAVVIDSNNDIIVGGYCNDSFACIRKFNGSLNILSDFNITMNIPNSINFTGFDDLAVDSKGNLYATASTNEGFFVVEFNSSGNQIWNRTINWTQWNTTGAAPLSYENSQFGKETYFSAWPGPQTEENNVLLSFNNSNVNIGDYKLEINNVDQSCYAIIWSTTVAIVNTVFFTRHEYDCGSGEFKSISILGNNLSFQEYVEIGSLGRGSSWFIPNLVTAIVAAGHHEWWGDFRAAIYPSVPKTSIEIDSNDNPIFAVSADPFQDNIIRVIKYEGGLYYYNRTFDNPGIYDWNVTCDSVDYESAFDNDTVEIHGTSSLNATFPEGVYEPLCCNISGTIYSGNAAVQNCNMSPLSAETIDCDTQEFLSRTAMHTFYITFVNLTASSGRIAECQIRMSNGSLKIVNSTITSGIVNSNYTINYTLNNNTDSINRSSPWEIYNCSIKSSSGGLLRFTNSSDSEYNITRRKIYIHPNTWTGFAQAGDDGYWASQCMSNSLYAFFNNTVKCDGSDLSFVSSIPTYVQRGWQCHDGEAGYGGADADCGELACGSIVHYSCPDGTASGYFGNHPFITSSITYLSDAGASAGDTDTGNCDSNTNICTGTLGILGGTVKYTYRGDTNGALKVRFDHPTISTSSFIYDKISSAEVPFTGLNVTAHPTYGSLPNQIVEQTAKNFRAEHPGGAWNAPVKETLYINHTSAGTGTVYFEIYSAVGQTLDNTLTDARYEVISSGPSNWDENHSYLPHTTTEYIKGPYNQPSISQSNHACNDHEDNDLDWYQDCSDIDCNQTIIGVTLGSDPIKCETGKETTCWDGFDNDNDNLVDCEDPDCNGSIGAYYSGSTPVKYYTGSANVAMCEYSNNYGQSNGAGGEGEYYYSSTPSSCNDLFDNDADYPSGNQWDIFSCDGSYSDCRGKNIDCFDAYSCWGRSGTNTGTCPLRENSTVLCQDNIDNDYDVDLQGTSSNWLSVYIPDPGFDSSGADCDDYDCYAIKDGSGDYICSASLTNVTEYDNNASTCWDNIDNDLDAYYWNGNYIANSSTGTDCKDPDCLNVVNPLNPTQLCLPYEFNLGVYDFCRNDIDDDFDDRPTMYGMISSCVDNIYDDTTNATSITNLSGTDCWARFQVCGPCPSIENYTWESCADDINNDYDTGTGNYLTSATTGIDCADTDCVGELATYKGTRCTSAGGENTTELCTDGKDNDGDGNSDCSDSNCDNIGVCEVGTEDTCNDGKDNDYDGYYDCSDTDCYSDANCFDPNKSGSCIIVPTNILGTIKQSGGGITRFEHQIREYEGVNYTIKVYGQSGHTYRNIDIKIGTSSNPFAYDPSDCSLTGPDADQFTWIDPGSYNGIRLTHGNTILYEYTIYITCDNTGGYAGTTKSYNLGLTSETDGGPETEDGRTISTTWYETVDPNVTAVELGGSIGNVLVIPYNSYISMTANASDNSGLICGCKFNNSGTLTGFQTSSTSYGKCRYKTGPITQDIPSYLISSLAKDQANNIGNFESLTSFDIRITPIDTTSNYRLSRPFYNSTDYTILNTGDFSFITGLGDSFSSCDINILDGDKNFLNSLTASSSASSNTITCSASINLSNYINTSQDGVYFIYANTTDSDNDAINSSLKVFYVCNSLDSSGTTNDGLNWSCSKADMDNDNAAEGLYTTLYNSLGTDHINLSCDSCPGIVNTGLDSDGDGIDDACDTPRNLTIWDSADQVCSDDNDCPGGYECKNGLCILENENRRARVVQYTGDNINFYANYTNETNGTITDAVCGISFYDLNDSMEFNNESQLYEYSRSFSSSGTYVWNVTCTKSYIFDTENDTVTINSIPSTPSRPSTTGGAPSGGAVRLTVCPQEWNCSDWENCLPNGIQYRECWDLNKCEDLYSERVNINIERSVKPIQIRNCIYEPKCNDGILNNNESDVDCGGPCVKCKDGKICRNDDDCENKCFLAVRRCYTPEISEEPKPFIEEPYQIRLIPILTFSAVIIVLFVTIFTLYKYELIRRIFDYYRAKKSIRIKTKPTLKKSDIEEYTQRVNQFFRNAADKGYTSKQIKVMLMKKGWSKKLVDQYYKNFIKNNLGGKN